MRLIDADALQRELEKSPYNDYDDFLRTERLIDDAPTVEERPKGKWIAIHKGYVCSNCNKYTITINDKHYCFKCGADMRGDV